MLTYFVDLDLGTGRPDVRVEDLSAELVPAAARAKAQLLHGHPESHQPLRVHLLQEHRQVPPARHALHYGVQRQSLQGEQRRVMPLLVYKNSLRKVANY